ncbi:MAG: glutamate formimidoyltransferase [Candidatus Atribacteria bacterium]|nr:glutamate formimidoyltransferase [Candidatus Atribacteria bacterium]
MKKKKQIVECVPNFSEGKDLTKIEKIVDPLKHKKGIKLLGYERDEDYNRLVVTVIGEPEPLKEAIIESMGVAIEVIDMRKHQGQHPRMGAIDVVPFIPIKNFSIDEAISLSKEVARIVYDKYNLPVFLYEKSATLSNRENLSEIRKGEFEGMSEKIKKPEWKPDYGSTKIHPTAGVTAVGAREPLIAYNINLNTNNLEIANHIARSIRHKNGGLRYCKAIGVALKERGIVQVSINMTDYTKTPLYRAFELVRIEAKRFGVNVIGSEIVGFAPLESLVNSAAYYLGLEKFSTEQILEVRMTE